MVFKPKPPVNGGIWPTGNDRKMFLPHDISFTDRPHRIRRARPQDTSPTKSYGDYSRSKDERHARIFFQNVKGLTHTTGCEDFHYCLDAVQRLEADIVGLSETNSPWLQSPNLQNDFRQCVRSHFGVGKVVFGSPSKAVDPISPSDTFQAGGNLTFTIGSLVPLVNEFTSSIQDSSGLGRWSALSFRGRRDVYFTVITAYRVCKGTL